MRLATIINHQKVIVFVDSGSIHYFVDHKLTKTLNLLMEQEKQLWVMIANRGSMTTQGMSKAMKWEA